MAQLSKEVALTQPNIRAASPCPVHNTIDDDIFEFGSFGPEVGQHT